MMRRFTPFYVLLLAILLPNWIAAQCGGGGNDSNGDDCNDPIELCTPDDLPVSSAPWTPDAPFTFCGGGATTENNGWISFVAASSPVIIDFNIVSCTNGNGIQGVIFSPTGGCGNFTELDCFTPGGGGAMDFTLNADVIPGETYFIMIDGFAGDLCDFEIDVIQGVNFAPPPPDDPEIVPDIGTVCQGDIVTFTIDNEENGVLYDWYSPDGLGFGPTQTIDFSDYSGEVEICVRASVPCSEACACITVEVEIPPIINPNNPNLCADTPGGSLLPYDVYMHLQELFEGLPVDGELNLYDSFGALMAMDPVSDGMITQPGTYEFYYDYTTEMGCYVVPDDQPLIIIIEDPEIFVALNDDLIVCVGDCLDLTDPEIVTVEDINNSEMPYEITFYGSENDAEFEVNPLDPAIAKADDGINPYWVRLETPSECFDVKPLWIEFDPIPELLITQPDPICGVPIYEFDLQDVDIAVTNGAVVDEYCYFESFDLAEQGINELTFLELMFDAPGLYTYWVVGKTENGCRSIPYEITLIFVQGPTAEISGDGEVCLNDEGTITFTFTGLPPWDVEFEDSHGNQYTESSDDPELEVTVILQDTGVCVFTITSIIDDSGVNCPGSFEGEATFYVHPDPELIIDGDETICTGDTAFIVFNIVGIGPFEVDYNDSELGDITISGIYDGYVLALVPTANTTITLLGIRDELGCEGNASGSYEITLIEGPQVINIDETCSGNQYFVTFEITGGDPGTYNVFGDPGTLTGNMWQGELIDVLTPYEYYVTDGNNCDTIPVLGQVDTCCQTMPGTMVTNPTLDFCVDETACAVHNGDEFLDFNDALEFILHTEPGTMLGTIIARSDMPCFDFQAPMVTGETYYISAVAGNALPDGTVDPADACFQVARGTPIIFHDLPEATLSADGDICIGDSYELSITFTGEAPFTFSYLADGTPVDTVTTNSNPFTITVSPGVTVLYELGEMNDRFCDGSVFGSALVNVNSAPDFTNLDFTCNDINTAYSATFDIIPGEGSTSYVIIDGPAGTTLNGVQVLTGDVLSGIMDTVFFTDNNACDTLAVPLFALCDCDTEAGTMDATLLELCEDEVATGIHNGDEVLDGNDFFEYILHEFSGGVIGNPVDTNTAPVFSFDPNTMQYEVTYYISSVAGDQIGNHVDQSDPCLDVADGQPVLWHQLPTATLSGDNETCYNSDSIQINLDFEGTAPFTFDLALNGTSVGQFTTSDDPYFFSIPTAATSGTYTLNSVSDANCTGTVSGSSSLLLFESPTFDNVERLCDTLLPFYVVSFDINGGAGSGNYVLVDAPAGTLINGSTVTTGIIASNTRDTVYFTDINRCDTIAVPFFKDCDCLTDAGTMITTPRVFCENEPGTAIYDGGFFLDSDDVLEFVLHTNPTDSLGDIIAVNATTTSFDFVDPPMQFGVTYYISAVAGNDDGTGFVDLQDTCLSVTQGTPVTWFPNPDASAVTDNNNIIDCQFTSLTLDGTMSTGFNAIDYFWSAISGSIDGATTGSTAIVSQGGEYQLLIVDQVSMCTDTAIIIIDENNTPPNVSINQPPVITCRDPLIQIDASASSSGPDFQIEWTTDPPGLLPAGTTSLMPNATIGGDYTLTITNTVNQCVTTVTVPVSVDQNPPVANAGPDLEFTCITTQVGLDGNSSSQGGDFVYSWTHANGVQINDPSSLTPTVFDIGNYILEVTNTSNGCIAYDTVLVSNNDAIPSIPFPDTIFITCFGENDGAIVFNPNDVVGGTPPYTFAISDGTNTPVFSPFSGFYNLGPGNYSVLMQDANGCQDSTFINLTEPDELQVVLPDDVTINLGDSLQINPIINMAVDTIIWSTNVDVMSDEELNPTVMPTSNTNYTITVIDANGCTANDAINVFVKKDRPVYPPSAFSPNGDGINDKFIIYAGPGTERINTFRIYTRWGANVFEDFDMPVNDESRGWDGTMDGELMNPAVFIWYAEILFLDGEVEIFKGDITLMR